jgi:transposase
MIPIASGVRVWIATGHADMRRGMSSLALLVPDAFSLQARPARRRPLRIPGQERQTDQILWYDGLACRSAPNAERGRFLWPSPADGVVTLAQASLAIFSAAAGRLIARI